MPLLKKFIFNISNLSCSVGRSKHDPRYLTARAKAHLGAFSVSIQNLSKTDRDKNGENLSSGNWATKQQKRHLLKGAFLNGRGGGIRTHDLTVPNRARYHLRYAPYIVIKWSGRRESNPRSLAPQASALPLSHSPIITAAVLPATHIFYHSFNKSSSVSLISVRSFTSVRGLMLLFAAGN